MSENKNTIGFKIEKLEDLGYTFQKPESSIPTERIDFSIENKLEIDDEEGKVAFILKPRFTTGKREPKLIAELIFKVKFDVHGLENILEKDGNDFILPDQFIVTLFSISYSSTRGVFYEKSRGTMAERLIIPIIDPKVILPMVEREDRKPAE